MKKTKGIALSLSIPALLSTPVAAERLLEKRIKKEAPDADRRSFLFQGMELSYLHKGHGRPLLLLHGAGIGCGLWEWEKVLTPLAESFSVYALELPGFGHSAKPKQTYTAYFYATVINAFITQVLGRPCAVAASNTAAVFALEAYALSPQNFRRLLLISPSGLGEKGPATKASRLPKEVLSCPILGSACYLWAASRPSIRRFLKKWVFSDGFTLPDDLITTCHHNAHRQTAGARCAFASFVTRYMLSDIRPRLSTLRLPLYVFWGEDAKLSPLEQLETLRALQPDAACYTFEGVGQLPHYERPKAFCRLTEEVLLGK